MDVIFGRNRSKKARLQSGRRPVPVFGLDIDNELLRQLWKGIIIDPIANWARLARRAAAAWAVPQPIAMEAAN
jgi:hypothetical protein